MSGWVLQLLSLQGEPIGEIADAEERSFTFPLNRVDTAAFRVRMDNPLADDILSMDALLRVYDDTRTLRMVGPIISVEEVSGDTGMGTLSVTAQGAGWRLQRRLIGKSTTGYSRASSTAMEDRGTIARDIVNTVNLEAYTGIRLGVHEPSSSTYVGPWYYKPVLEAITELSSPLGGFDFWVEPVEPVAEAAGLTIGQFNIYAARGQHRPDVVFEYGGGNVKSYVRNLTNDGLMNYGYNLPPNFPDNSTQSPIFELDQASIDLRGRYEALVSEDLVSDDMRRTLLQEHVRIRKQARQTITFTPGVLAPKFGVDYDVGDVVRGRGRVAGVDRFDADFRIYEVGVSLTSEGMANTTVQLVPSS